MGTRLIYTGIRSMDVGDVDEVPLIDGLSLIRPNERLIADDDRPMMSQLQFSDARNASRFMLLRYEVPTIFSEREAAIESAETLFRSGMAAIQIVKPVETLGLIFRGDDFGDSIFVNQIEHRHQMDAGEWARYRHFDMTMLAAAIDMIPRVKAVLEGSNAELKNAVSLLQLGMENYHPLIAGMLWVMGMEAIFDSSNRNDFKDKLCVSVVFWPSLQRCRVQFSD